MACGVVGAVATLAVARLESQEGTYMQICMYMRLQPAGIVTTVQHPVADFLQLLYCWLAGRSRILGLCWSSWDPAWPEFCRRHMIIDIVMSGKHPAVMQGVQGEIPVCPLTGADTLIVFQ